LSGDESEQWQAHLAARLLDGAGGMRSIEMLFSEIDQLSESASEEQEEILGALYEYAESLAPVRS
jgi:exodeoxyribonuclease-1